MKKEIEMDKFQSPYGDFGNVTRNNRCRRYNDYRFQSPYGDFGNVTLSPSTRSQPGLTGDFFKPRPFFAFFEDPGEK